MRNELLVMTFDCLFILPSRVIGRKFADLWMLPEQGELALTSVPGSCTEVPDRMNFPRPFIREPLRLRAVAARRDVLLQPS